MSTLTSRHQSPHPARPGLAHVRTTPAQPDPAKPSLAQPDPKRPSFTSRPRNPRRFTYCAAISQVSNPNPGRNPTKRSTHNRARRVHPHSPIFAPAERIPPTLTRARRRLKSSVLRYLDFRPGLGPDLRDIAAQYSSDNPNPESQERDVVHEPVRCPAAPRDVCCDIACFGPRFTSWREISQHTSLENHRLHGAYG